jgi:hypothetical protein
MLATALPYVLDNEAQRHQVENFGIGCFVEPSRTCIAIFRMRLDDKKVIEKIKITGKHTSKKVLW